jgi:hypothetical protein
LTFSRCGWPALLGLCAALGGCADGPGHGFATLESAELSGRLEPGVARDLGGAVLTNRGYEVSLVSLDIDVERLALEALQGGAEAAPFDPAHPPPGFLLCHGGHCHAVDGRLVEYAEVEAGLAGGQAAFVPIVSLPVSAPLSLEPAGALGLVDFEPSDELVETTLRRASVLISGFRASGSVTGSGIDAAGAPLSVDLALPSSLSKDLTLAINREGPERLELRVVITADGTLFDDLDFVDLQGAEGISIVDPESAAALTLGSSLLESDVEVSF